MKFRLHTNSLKGLIIHISMILTLCCLLSFTLFYKILPVLTNQGDIVTVPDLKGMTLDGAIEFVKDKHVGFEVADSSYNSELPPLVVLEQYPKPNSKVKAGRKIHLKLNAKVPPTIRFPDLAGSTFELAQSQLRSIGLAIGVIQYRIDIAHNAILESKIKGEAIHAGDRIPKGSKIDLVIGTLKDQFPMPDFKDQTFDKAEASILSMNLKVKEVHFVFDEDKQENTVQKQFPNAGDTVRLGDEIELWIAKIRQH